MKNFTKSEQQTIKSGNENIYNDKIIRAEQENNKQSKSYKASPQKPIQLRTPIKKLLPFQDNFSNSQVYSNYEYKSPKNCLSQNLSNITSQNQMSAKKISNKPNLDLNSFIAQNSPYRFSKSEKGKNFNQLKSPSKILKQNVESINQKIQNLLSSRMNSKINDQDNTLGENAKSYVSSDQKKQIKGISNLAQNQKEGTQVSNFQLNLLQISQADSQSQQIKELNQIIQDKNKEIQILKLTIQQLEEKQEKRKNEQSKICSLIHQGDSNLQNLKNEYLKLQEQNQLLTNKNLELIQLNTTLCNKITQRNNHISQEEYQLIQDQLTQLSDVQKLLNEENARIKIQYESQNQQHQELY